MMDGSSVLRDPITKILVLADSAYSRSMHSVTWHEAVGLPRMLLKRIHTLGLEMGCSTRTAPLGMTSRIPTDLDQLTTFHVAKRAPNIDKCILIRAISVELAVCIVSCLLRSKQHRFHPGRLATFPTHARSFELPIHDRFSTS